MSPTTCQRARPVTSRPERVICRSCGARARRRRTGSQCECLEPCDCPRYGLCRCGGRMDRVAGRGRPRKLEDGELERRWPEVLAGTISRRQLAAELGVNPVTLSAAAQRRGLVGSGA